MVGTAYVLRPFKKFFELESSGGLLLMLSAVIALIWANSPLASTYSELWNIPVTIGTGAFVLSKPLILWINDGLMAVFFFVVGLEIKREILIGELSSVKKAALPIAAALGGMIVPATIYALINGTGPGVPGWGIPMATDIAFALGVVTLLGSRVPLSLKVFLTALAIIDDLGAVLVIALFYTSTLSWASLAIGFGLLVMLGILNKTGIRSLPVYLVVGIFVWIAFLKSGVHATIAGVLLAMTIPSTQALPIDQFFRRSGELLHRIKPLDGIDSRRTTVTQRDAIHSLSVLCGKADSPLSRLEHVLHPWVAFFIMPVFALANAGVTLEGNPSDAFTNPVTLGIIAGLFVGKQIGVMLFSWLSVRLGIAALPGKTNWRQMYGISLLTGIGFTMSLFIATLAFDDVVLLADSKIGILAASILSGLAGWLLLRRLEPTVHKDRQENRPEAVPTV